jgi:phosphoacetylglucosamine mutase|eukprot:scaffold3855_cov199-Alexandrium_tamarense.AAC.47
MAPKIHQGYSIRIPDSKLAALIDAYPKPSSLANYSYGTAGFRYEASLLPCVFVRMGIFSALRSASLGGEEVGVMITASHNPEPDNGMKLADSNGGMLDAAWEEHAVSLANAPTSKQALILINTLSQYAMGHHGAGGKLPKMVVHIGRDTRSHSPGLANLVIRAARAMGATVIDHGEVSTPMLHHFVMHANGHLLPSIIPQRCNESGYYEIMALSYAALLRTGGLDGGSGGRRLATTTNLVIDGACGIGALKIDTFRKIFGKLNADGATKGLALLHTVNFPGEGPLNENCGAEYVQKQQLPPELYSPASKLAGLSKKYMTSYDGDADRVVFHYEDDAGKFHLLDGDKIAVLVSSFIQEELRCIDPEEQAVKCGVVQTAYANGSSTLYLQNVVKTNVVIAKTGVKFVHAAAHHHYDVGVYFEANGHGTVLFGPKFYDFIASADARLRGTPRSNRANIALRRLRVLPALVNQSVGDAMSDMLLVDAILFLRGWDLSTWAQLYNDMPSKQAKVKVADRTVITTNDNETAATSPAALQKALQSAMDAMALEENTSSGPKPRCFVRPSGTEDAVRVYAEANSQSGADSLASEAMMLIYKLCGGVGAPPQPLITNRL